MSRAEGDEGPGVAPVDATRLVVIVPVHDGGEDIAACLGGLIAAGQPPGDIHVVDDGSRDGAAAAAAGVHGIAYRMLADGPNGPARARNAGAAAASDAGAFLFVDADVVVHPDALERFRALLADRDDVAAAFGSYDDAPTARGWISQYKNLVHHFVHQRGGGEASTFWSGCGMVRRDAFVAVGGFDEGFGRASIEDVDLGLRLTDAGYRVLLRPDILCTHRKVWTLASWLRTDIFLRALPWSRLLSGRGQGVPDTLNLGHRERLSAVFAGVVLLAMLALPFQPGKAVIVLGISLAAFVALQRDLLGFFVRRRGWAFAAAATAMHLCYFVYSAAVFVGVRLAAPFTGEPFPRRS